MEENKFRAGFREKIEYVKGDSEKRKPWDMIGLHTSCKEGGYSHSFWEVLIATESWLRGPIQANVINWGELQGAKIMLLPLIRHSNEK